MPSWKYCACVDCGKVRLVQTHYGKPRSLRCKSCSKIGANHPQYGKFGEGAAHWKGGQYTDVRGYVFVHNLEHHRTHNGHVKRAVLVLESKLNRLLRDGYDAHHKNEIKDDDNPKNLEEKPHGEHAALHLLKRRFNHNEPSLRHKRVTR